MQCQGHKERLFRGIVYSSDKQDLPKVYMLYSFCRYIFFQVEHKPCIDRALSYFNDWKNTGKEIPANIKDVVYNTGIRNGNSENWNFMYQKFRDATIDSERLKYIFALGNNGKNFHGYSMVSCRFAFFHP